MSKTGFTTTSSASTGRRRRCASARSSGLFRCSPVSALTSKRSTVCLASRNGCNGFSTTGTISRRTSHTCASARIHGIRADCWRCRPGTASCASCDTCSTRTNSSRPTAFGRSHACIAITPSRSTSARTSTRCATRRVNRRRTSLAATRIGAARSGFRSITS